MIEEQRCAVVVIGRNEGDRLVRCFGSIDPQHRVIYVDSGSTDNSVAEAQKRGFTVIALDTSRGFTAARARNAGWRAAAAAQTVPEYIQFVDGDCEFAPDWIETAMAALDAEPSLCSVFGRRRERFPQASPYNALCDAEWNVPAGLVEACGGDVLFRLNALQEVDGYRDDLIAGEEPDLCLRLGALGWQIRCIDAEMTLHDAAIFTAGQWWKRTKRSGHAYAEHVARHGALAFGSWRKALRGILLWGLTLPALIALLVLAALIAGSVWASGAAVVMSLAYPANVVRLTLRQWRGGVPARLALFDGFWLVFGKFAGAAGALQYWRNRLSGRRGGLIEYKGASA